MQRGSIGPVQHVRRLTLAVSLAVLALFANAPHATAAVTIGQLAPGGSPTAFCNAPDPLDVVQPTVTSGNGYVLPSTGGITSWTITSWSTNAASGPGQALTFKVLRPLAPSTYRVVGHDGPRPIAPDAVNTFIGFSITAQAGDVIGLHHEGASAACIYEVPGEPGESHLERLGNLADGESGTFVSDNQRVNATAVANPSNSFTLAGVKLNRKKGTATITANVPNPGELALSGKGVNTASAARAVIAKTVTAPGDVKLKVRAKGKKKRKLIDTGKAKVNLEVTFTPTGGDPNTQSRKLKLKQR